MYSTNSNNIRMIDTFIDNTSSLNVNWLQLTNVNNDYELSDQYAQICQLHKQEKKWILFINPQESSIDKLAKTHNVDVSKILMVNFKNALKANAKVDLERVKSVLSKGNCSAVILSNAYFQNEEITQLERAARAGKTQCVLLKKQVLH